MSISQIEGMKMAESDKHVAEVIAVLDARGNEALYIDGLKVFSQVTIYIGDIVRHAGGRPIILTQAILADDFDDRFEDWPEKYEDLIPYIEAD
jgi:hypothetical protein